MHTEPTSQTRASMGMKIRGPQQDTLRTIAAILLLLIGSTILFKRFLFALLGFKTATWPAFEHPVYHATLDDPTMVIAQTATFGMLLVLSMVFFKHASWRLVATLVGLSGLLGFHVIGIILQLGINAYLAIAIMLGVAIVQVAKRPSRTLDRIFTTAISAIILLSSLLLHFALISAPLVANVTATFNDKVLTNTANLPTPYFRAACQQFGYRCYEHAINTPYSDNKPFVRDFVERVLHSKAFRQQVHMTTSHAIRSRETGFRVQIGVARLGDRYRVLVDDHALYARTTQLTGVQFGLLGGIVHIFWAGSGFGLLFWHKRRLARRRNLQDLLRTRVPNPPSEPARSA